jgi:hypothetical protein
MMVAIDPGRTAAAGSATGSKAKDAVVEVRREALTRAGFDAIAAGLIASRFDIVVEDAIRLLRRGCPISTCLEILL